MPGYPFTYEEILEMWREWALRTQNARAIMRKADFRRGGAAQAPPVPILSLEGSRRFCMDPTKVFPHSRANFSSEGGKLRAWGNNLNDLMGLQVGEYVEVYTQPTRIAGAIDDAVEVASHRGATAVLRSDGSVWQSGDRNAVTLAEHAFAPAPDVEDAVWVDSSEFTTAFGEFYAVLSDGTVLGQGEFLPGMGPGLSGHWATDLVNFWPMPSGKVSGITRTAALLLGMAFLRDDGTVFSWDYDHEFPYSPPALPDPAVKVAASIASVFALTEAGEIYVSGGNSFGEHGNGTTSGVLDYETWDLVDGGPYIDVAAASFAAFAISDAGDLYSWGRGGAGTGFGAAAVSGRGFAALDAPSPVLITTGPGGGWEAVYGHANSLTPMAKHGSGCVYIWGQQDFGQFGRGYSGNPFDYLYEPAQILVSQAYPAWPVS